MIRATHGIIQSSGSVETTVTTDSPEPVEGVFQVEIALASANPSFSTSDITVTNGTVENLFSEDDINWTCNIIPNSAGDVTVEVEGATPLVVTIDEDWAFLTNSSTSDLYYEMRELAGANASNIGASEPAMLDRSGNGRNLALQGSPTRINWWNVAGVGNVDTFVANFSTTNCLNTQQKGTGFLDRASGFSVVLAARCADGQQAAAYALCGAFNGTIHAITFDVTTAGILRIRHQGFTWESSAAVFPNGETGLIQIEAHFDFVNDVLDVLKDGVAVSGSFTSGDIVGTDPTAFVNTTRNIQVGSFNNNGSIFSNPSNTPQIAYFAVTTLQDASRRSSVRTYLLNRRPSFEVVDVLSGFDFPHDVELNSDATRAFVIGKGADSATNQDGTFAIADISDPENLSILGSYGGFGDLIDGETVTVINDNRVLVFAQGQAHLFNVSNPASPTIVKTIAYTGDASSESNVVNGAAIILNRYVVGAVKAGRLAVFDMGVNLSDPDNFTLTGQYDTSTDTGNDGPHDVFVTSDGEHVCVCARGNTDATNHFLTYKIVDSEVLIDPSLWALLGSSNSATLAHTNRTREMYDGVAITCGNPNFATIDISDLSAPAVLSSFNQGVFSSGVTRYKNRWAIPTWQVGTRLLKIASNGAITEDARYYNDLRFTTGNASFHDLKTFKKNGIWYALVSAQSSSEMVCFRINRH